MRLVKIGLSNRDSNVGAFKTNTENLIKDAETMSRMRCDVGVFSEGSLSGYPAEDIVLWEGFVSQQRDYLFKFLDETQHLYSVFTIGLEVLHEGKIFNCAAVCYKGKLLGLVPKLKLPNSGILYDGRTFAHGDELKAIHLGKDWNHAPFGEKIYHFPFGKLAFQICEDLWTPDGPISDQSLNGAELIVNLSASPTEDDKIEQRRSLVSHAAFINQVTIAYTSKMGGQGSLVFDGASFINQNGNMILEGSLWKEHILSAVVDLDETTRNRMENTSWRLAQENREQNIEVIDCRDLFEMNSQVDHGYPDALLVSKRSSKYSSYRGSQAEKFDNLIQAIKTGIKGYVEKTGDGKVFKRLVISLSGGKDSALCLLICWMYAQERFAHLPEKEKKAAIKDFIHCFSFPTRHNSELTQSIAQELANELGVTFYEVPIGEIVTSTTDVIKETMNLDQLIGTPYHNLQARLRGSVLTLTFANLLEALVIQTSNRTEGTVGYTTTGGDLEGGYGPIKNLQKTFVINILKYIEEYPEVLNYLDAKYGLTSLKKLNQSKASAELEDNQEDEKDLMPFVIMDECFHLFVVKKLMPYDVYKVLRMRYSDECLQKMYPDYQVGDLKNWVIKYIYKFFGNIFKWVQAPEGVHLCTPTVDRERAFQLQTSQSTEWLEDSIQKIKNDV